MLKLLPCREQPLGSVSLILFSGIDELLQNALPQQFTAEIMAYMSRQYQAVIFSDVGDAQGACSAGITAVIVPLALGLRRIWD